MFAVVAFCAHTTTAAAATIKSDDILTANANAFERDIYDLTLNIVQQINIPITINQAFAIGIRSHDIEASTYPAGIRLHFLACSGLDPAPGMDEVRISLRE